MPRLSDPDNVRFNFTCGLLHGVFYRAGIAFSEPTGVLPVFLNHYTGSLTMIGLFSALIQGGGVIPQLFVANRLERAPRKKPLLLAAIWIRAAAWGVLGLLAYFWHNGDTTLVLTALLTLLFVFSFAGGVAAVPFNDIWGKVLPATIRGRFFGHRQLWGGVLALGAAYIVKRVLGDSNLVFPNNFGVLFLLSFGFLVVSYIALSSVREPDGEVIAIRRPLAAFLRESSRLVWEDCNLRRLLMSRLTIGFGAFAAPFYVLFGKHELQMPSEQVGILVAAQVCGAILSNLVWAEISDRLGNRIVIRLTGIVGMLIPVVALTSNFIGGSFLLVIVFGLLGCYFSGTGIGFNNYLLEIAPAPLRPAYIALSGTLAGTTFLLPIAGGIVVDLWGYDTAFSVATAVAAVGFGCAMTLRCVRTTNGAMPSKEQKIEI